MKLAFLASNNGSGMRAIVGAIEAGELAAEARLVISNRPQSPALAFARDHGVEARFIPTVADPDGADARLVAVLGDSGAEWVILSGYLRKLGPRALAAYRGRILNIHPALLPKFGGQGMYGRRVHEAVLAAAETHTGASVHIVDGDYDHGPVIAQAKVTVAGGDDADAIERKVTAVEPGLLVDTLRRIAEGSLICPR